MAAIIIFLYVSSLFGVVSSLGDLMSPRLQLSAQFLAMKAKGNSMNVKDVLATAQFPSAWPYSTADLSRQDESIDTNFYDQPRFCFHVDEKAVAALTDYYSTEFPKFIKKEGNNNYKLPDVLDLCASHVSHFPVDVADYTGRRVALGMNQEELAQNTQVDEFVVKDLNKDPTLPFDDNSFDIVTNAVSIDYLTNPLDICTEVARVLKPGGCAMFALSNRCFPTKAIQLWLKTNDLEHVYAVGSYFHYTKMFQPPSATEVGPNPVWVLGQSQNIAYLSVVRATVDK
mmetsp:Transcript_9692/g.11193  ORF Transcript_9692/g.11193 Transcript_9692/m.11193 type:complete len:285 (+) Transcript_9692:52-906(+)|eukprot:CAMPEP_0170771066 /NCGR_PEP_ID=MMETSP0733-20121128/7840_1 /TAXON_ID=186038 /ORGANISM="Fragilariopsis kerguelensis, Strain L26-C5" /LENGTH=284 /DNA_ID=CAMNT_0011112759 /DNA_START=50 /DNA_END=904 /DNA_ORIENTATION=-